jgi:hypothetical protein
MSDDKSQSVIVENTEPVPVVVAQSSPPPIPVLPIPGAQSKEPPPASLLLTSGDMSDGEIARVAAVVAAEVAERLANARVDENALHSASQRKVNLIWEYTQMSVALSVVVTTMIVGAYTGIAIATDKPIPTILSVAFGTVVGFYFGRTNHQTVGGVQLGR